VRPSRLTLPALILGASTFLGVAAPTATGVAASVDASQCTNAARWQDAYNKKDATAVAALYTANGIEVTPVGIVAGQAAIKNRVDDFINKLEWKNADISVAKCDVEGRLRWSTGSWKDDTPQGAVGGFWTAIEVKDGDAWKIQNLTFNMTPPPSNK